MTDHQLVKNKLPVWLKYIVLFFPFVVACFQLRHLDNDFFFLYPTGEYILNHGFPHTDFLSMHSNMKIVVQQWLSSVIFYLSYSKLGKIGLFALLYASFAGICFFTYRLNILISKNELIAVFMSTISSTIIFAPLIVTRPQTFTYLLLLIELYLLEKHVQTKKIRYLIGLPLISLAIINLHASMWSMMFIFMLPFIAGAIPVHYRAIKHEAEGNLLYLLLSMALSAAAGFINPYGMENVFYLFSSYGDTKLNDTIAEMLPTNITTTYGKILIGILLLMGIAVFFFKKNAFSVRHFCLFFGTLILGFLHRKGTPYFFIFGMSAFTYAIKDFELKLPEKLTSRITKTAKVLIAAILIITTGFTCGNSLLKSIDSNRGFWSHYKDLDAIIAILKESEEPVILYANFNDGQYFEYNGFHPYIDGRAELFLEQNNKEFDYYGEWCDLRSAKVYYRDFLDKYGFNYVVLGEATDRYLFASIIRDDDFEIKYQNGSTYLFVRK